jgi:hypothetical protein
MTGNYPTYLVIDLEDLELKFRIRPTALAALWVNRMNARGDVPLDHPDRFYGFNDQAQEEERAAGELQRCMNIINQHEPIIERDFTNVHDQDLLNYLHNIFERYHGLLNQQDSDYWKQAPAQVRTALAELNLAVHRCESLESVSPRMVCTWYGMPKQHVLDLPQHLAHASLQVTFGTVYLNYAEVGKTLEDLTRDNDQYIGDDAFKPFGHYSADFNVAFYNLDLTKKITSMKSYFEEHKDFFLAKNINNIYNAQALPLRFPVADLVEKMPRDKLIMEIAKRQKVTRVKLT